MSNTHEIDAVVIGMVPEFGLAIIRTTDGAQYVLTDETPGIVLGDISEGQAVRCTVTERLPRVVRAAVV